MEVKNEKDNAATDGGTARLEARATSESAGFPLELEQLRAVIEVVENQCKYRLAHVFDPVTAADWLEFDQRTRLVMESDGDTISFDSMAPERCGMVVAGADSARRGV